MFSKEMRLRLRDPDYLDMHMAAASAIGNVKAFPWYDAHFLQFFEAAKRYLAIVCPQKLEQFCHAFAPLRTPADFAVKEISQVFVPEVLERVREEVRTIPEARLEQHETENFGRLVVYNHSYFTTLQEELLPMVSELVGCRLTAGYNFLSLYGSTGRCAPHMDHPNAMYTLDLCIDQDVEWPIWFSDRIEWPGSELMNNFDPDRLLREVPFRDYVLKPNNAILFSGSSQWHYRDAMPKPGFCNLLFFHYYPHGCENLVHFKRWPETLGIEELAPFCDLIAEAYADRYDPDENGDQDQSAS